MSQNPEKAEKKFGKSAAARSAKVAPDKRDGLL